MGKSKARMPKELEKKCHGIIHTATVAATAAGAIPIPMSDTIPISGTQLTMIIALEKVFDVTLSQFAAKSLATITLARGAGKALVSNILKAIPGVGTVVGGVILGVTAATLTEGLGWLIADDFYRMSQGDEPENIVETAGDLKSLFK